VPPSPLPAELKKIQLEKANRAPRENSFFLGNHNKEE
jgi:hypothetical protein